MDVQSTKYAIIEKVIQTNDENVLNEISAILEQEEIVLSESQKAILDKRTERHQRGESKNYTWEEVKTMAREGL